MASFVEIVAGFVIFSLSSLSTVIAVSLLNNLLGKCADKNDSDRCKRSSYEHCE